MEKQTTVMVFGNPLFKQNESVCTSRCTNDLCTKLNAPHEPLIGRVDGSDVGKRTFRTSIAKPYPHELCSKCGQLIIEDYIQRRHGPPNPVLDCKHNTKWSDLTSALLDVSMMIDLCRLPLTYGVLVQASWRLHRLHHHVTTSFTFLNIQVVRLVSGPKLCENNTADNSATIL